MRPIEILNNVSKKIFELSNSKEGTPQNEFVPFVDPEEFNDNAVEFINGRLIQITKDEYLKECIKYFLLDVLALKNQNILKGYQEASQIVKTIHGFGKVNDIVFSIQPKPNQNVTYRIRIHDLKETSISYDENFEMQLWQGKYIIVKSFDEFYNWYISKFGNVEV